MSKQESKNPTAFAVGVVRGTIMRRRRARAQYCKGELIEREDFSEDLAAFKFRVDKQLPFIPGQYATIGFQVGEKIAQRPYSIVSSPHEPFMEVFVEFGYRRVKRLPCFGNSNWGTVCFSGNVSSEGSLWRRKVE